MKHKYEMTVGTQTVYANTKKGLLEGAESMRLLEVKKCQPSPKNRLYRVLFTPPPFEVIVEADEEAEAIDMSFVALQDGSLEDYVDIDSAEFEAAPLTSVDQLIDKEWLDCRAFPEGAKTIQQILDNS